MGLKREEKVRRLREMHRNLSERISTNSKSENPLCLMYTKMYKGHMSDDLGKFKYFKPAFTHIGATWFDSDVSRLAALNDLIDMYTGYYSPTLRERIRNIVRYILFYF